MMDTDALTAAVIDEHEAETNVKVMIRFRPENTKEVRSDTTKEFDIQYSDNEKAVKLSQTEVGKLSVERSYTFDKVFAPTATQAYVFEHLARGTVDDVVKGFNGTVFAYGQTGSGKTWSMFGINTPEGRGVIPRSAEYLFDELQRADEIKQVTIKCSFLEIYKERVRDLLNPRQTESLKLRETPRGAVRVVGLLEEYVSSPDDIMALVAAGERIRSVSKTEMNDISSRSHTLLTVTVTQKLQDASIRVGKLNMADLAGSERVDKSGLQGVTLGEAKKINASLSALGNCINALTDQKRTHVPFRDSKLTYILKDSLGGNTKTSLLVTCSPHPANSDETLSSLMFAQRASHVKNNVRVNRQLSVQELQQLVAQLRRQLAESRAHVKQLTKDGRLRTGGGLGGSIDDLDQDALDDMLYGGDEHAGSMSMRNMPRGAGASAAYAAMGQAIGSADYVENEQKRLTKAQRSVKAQSLPGPSDDAAAQMDEILDQMAELTEFQDLEQFGEQIVGGSKVATNNILASNSLAMKQRLMLKQNVAGGTRGNSAEPGILNDAHTAEYDDNVGEEAVGGNVLQRAKNAVRRSLDAEPDDDIDDEDDRSDAKMRLQEELAAAKKRREDLRASQRKRADQWAAKKIDDPVNGASNDDLTGRGDGRPRARQDKGLTIVTGDNAPLKGDQSPLQWSPVGSPIPPPPNYAYPVEPDADASPEPRYEAKRAKDDANVDTNSNSTSRSKTAAAKPEVKAQPFVSKSGKVVSYRLDLIPDPDNPSLVPETRSVGFIDVDPMEDVNLEDLRKRVLVELDHVPSNFIFTRKGVPIGTRQEKKRTLSYIRADGNVICIRIDSTKLV